MSIRPFVAVVAVMVVAFATGCAPEAGAGASIAPTTSLPTPAPTTSTASGAATSSATPDPSATTGAVPVGCWSIELPDAAVTATQTPEEFEAQNPGLVASGAATPCSLFADGSLVTVGDAWIDSLLSQGWTDRGRVEDEVYVSRSATSPNGTVAAYLATAPESAAQAVTQFMTYHE